ncbi:MAG: hypothetical protein H6832_17385 [Planctomycetes bacterium]|nr:hypothetical protein [Planctomycetota bacterium]
MQHHRGSVLTFVTAITCLTSPACTGGGSRSPSLIQEVTVRVDVAPESSFNRIYIDSSELVRIAIYTKDAGGRLLFAASQIELASLLIGPGGARFTSHEWIDLDSDGESEFVGSVRASDLGLETGSSAVTIEGRAPGVRFRGNDVVLATRSPASPARVTAYFSNTDPNLARVELPAQNGALALLGNRDVHGHPAMFTSVRHLDRTSGQIVDVRLDPATGVPEHVSFGNLATAELRYVSAAEFEWTVRAPGLAAHTIRGPRGLRPVANQTQPIDPPGPRGSTPLIVDVTADIRLRCSRYFSPRRVPLDDATVVVSASGIGGKELAAYRGRSLGEGKYQVDIPNDRRDYEDLQRELEAFCKALGATTRALCEGSSGFGSLEWTVLCAGALTIPVVGPELLVFCTILTTGWQLYCAMDFDLDLCPYIQDVVDLAEMWKNGSSIHVHVAIPPKDLGWTQYPKSPQRRVGPTFVRPNQGIDPVLVRFTTEEVAHVYEYQGGFHNDWWPKDYVDQFNIPWQSYPHCPKTDLPADMEVVVLPSGYVFGNVSFFNTFVRGIYRAFYNWFEGQLVGGRVRGPYAYSQQPIVVDFDDAHISGRGEPNSTSGGWTFVGTRVSSK